MMTAIACKKAGLSFAGISHSPLNIPSSHLFPPSRNFSLKICFNKVAFILSSIAIHPCKVEKEYIASFSNHIPQSIYEEFIHQNQLIKFLQVQQLSLCAGVHDSYWTHAGDVEQMNLLLREKFVELYNQPILENVSYVTWLDIELPPCNFSSPSNAPNHGWVPLQQSVNSV